jgi:hypothetical protein
LVKNVVLAVFRHLNDIRGRGFHKLNQALLTFLPKCPDDYRPISLVHLIGKVAAKVLSLRLAPKLDRLVSKS